MAKLRKPMDLGGLDAVLPSEGVDLIGNVIASDRRRSGRGEYKPDASADYDNMTSPMTNGQASPSDDILVSPPTDILASPSVRLPASPPAVIQTHMPASIQLINDTPELDQNPPEEPAIATDPKPKPKAIRQAPPPAGNASRRQASHTNLLTNRISQAAEMANSRTMTVTLRLPQELNDWLDEYVHESWRDRLKKQQLVIEALCMLVARRGRAGENVIPTELLGEDPNP